MKLWVAWVLIACIAAAFASRWVLSKWVLNDKVSPHTVFTLSSAFYFVAAAATVGVVMLAHKPARQALIGDVTERMNWKHWLILCGFPLAFAVAGYLVVYILSTMNVSVLYPVYNALMLFLTVVASLVFLREGVSGMLVVGLVCIFSGIGLTIAHSFTRSQ